MLKEISNDIRSAFQGNRNGVTQLLVVNIAVFIVVGTLKVVLWAVMQNSQALNPIILKWLCLSPLPEQLIYKPWTLLTYSVTHIDLFHFIFNMFGLYWFGQILQDFLGPKRILQFYIAGALAGGLLFLLLFNLLPTGTISGFAYPLIGASGAVYGIICAAAFLVPNYTMNLLLLGPVKLKYIAAATLLISFLQIPDANAGGNIAHLGGALGGVLFLKYLQGGFWKPSFKRAAPQLKGKVVRMENRVANYASQQDELDRLLDKISEKGIHSLSKEERTRLEHLSKPGNNHE